MSLAVWLCKSEVCVGAEGLSVCVNRAYLHWQLIAIDQPRLRNDKVSSEVGVVYVRYMSVYVCVCVSV